MEDAETLVTLTADIVAAHVTNNSVAISDIPGLIRTVHEALAGLSSDAQPEPEPQQPAVSVRASVKPDYIVCLEDGKKLTMMRRWTVVCLGKTGPILERADCGERIGESYGTSTFYGGTNHREAA